MPMPSLPKNLDRVPEGMSPPDLAGLMRPSSFGMAAGVAQSRLQVLPNRPFFLRHHPRAWLVSTTLPEPMCLPDVTKLVIAPGVNGIRTVKKNEEPDMAYRRAIQDSQLRGWTYLDPAAPIPNGCLPKGVAPGSYIREANCQGPKRNRSIGTFYMEAWQVPTATLPGDFQNFQFDRAHYERWLKFLVESGQIAPMIPGILSGMTARARDHHERALGLNLQPHIAKKFIGMRAEILANYEAATPAARQSPEAVQETLAGYLAADSKKSKKSKVKS